MFFHQPWNSLSNYNYNIRFYKDDIWEKHIHKNFELVYVIKGRLNCTLNNESFVMTEGEFALCLPYEIHSYLPDKETEYWIIVFSGDFVHSFSKEITNKIGSGRGFRVKKCIEEYVKEQLIYNNIPTMFTLKSCLYAICEEYLSSVSLTDNKNSKSELVGIIIDFVQERYAEKISLRDIAKVAGYDYNYMSRCFKNIFNMSFTDFVNLYRIENAIELLETTNDKITEIALKSGFQSVRSFNEVFKKNVKVTPMQYKKTSRKV